MNPSSQSQGRLWSVAPADWMELQERFSNQLWERMLASAHVGRGTRLLDAGCGTGGASALARRLGAVVTGIDAAAGMIDVARRRLPDAALTVGGLDSLPYDPHAFDVAFAASSIQFAADPRAAANELRRVTRPGGSVVIAVFGPRADVEYSVILDVVSDLLPLDVGRDPFALSEGTALETLVSGAGLEIVESETTPAPFVFSDPESLWRGVRSSGAVQSAVEAVGSEVVEGRILLASAPFRRSDGTYRFESSFRFVTGRVPE